MELECAAKVAVYVFGVNFVCTTWQGELRRKGAEGARGGEEVRGEEVRGYVRESWRLMRGECGWELTLIKCACEVAPLCQLGQGHWAWEREG